MGDPLKSANPSLPSETPQMEAENPIVSISNPIPEPQVQISNPVPIVQNPLPAAVPIKDIEVAPITQNIVPTAAEPPKITPVVQPIKVPEPAPVVLEPKPITTENSLSLNEAIIPKPNLSRGWRKIALLIFALLILIIVIIISVFLIKSNNTPSKDNVVSAPVENVVSLPAGFVLKDYSGRIYNLDFKYSSELGTASSITTKITYPSDPGVNGDCNLENITFSNESSLTIGISTGHCEGGSGASANYTKLTSKDGKSFFMIVKTLDAKLFPDMSTITVSGGIDSTDTFVAGITGVHIDAIRIKDPEKYKKFIEDILSTMTVELSPLKSEDFDTKSNI